MTRAYYAESLVSMEEGRIRLGVDERTMKGLLSAHILVRVSYWDSERGLIELLTQSSVVRLEDAAIRAREAYER